MLKNLVIGLDGATLDVIQPMIDDGTLPFFKKIQDTGFLLKSKSTIPPISSISWSSIITGKQAGKHGIYDFLTKLPENYEIVPISSKMRKGTTLFKQLNTNGHRAAAINIPCTYPPEPIDGYFIPGWLAPRKVPDISYPIEFLSELEKKFGEYPLYPKEIYSKHGTEKFNKELFNILDYRIKVLKYLIQDGNLDFIFYVLFDSDRVQHEYWHYFDKKHPWNNTCKKEKKINPIKDYFIKVDSHLEDIYNTVKDNANMFILSDHGFGPLHNLVFLNNWLLKEKYISLKNSVFIKLKKIITNMGFNIVDIHSLLLKINIAKYLENQDFSKQTNLLRKLFLSFSDVDWQQTKAYSYGIQYGKIFVNLKGREPNGIVNPGKEYEELLDELQEKIYQIDNPFTEKKLIKKVYRKTELYSGVYLNNAPDLTLEPMDKTDYFFGVSDFGGKDIFKKAYRYSGTHRDYGILGAIGKDIKNDFEFEKEFSVLDIMPTILYLYSSKIPKDTDGRILKEIFRPEVLKHLGTELFDDLNDYEDDSDDKYDGKNRQELESQLRNLGYIT